jgi:hypothetical protein
MKFGHCQGTKREKYGSGDWYAHIAEANIATVEAAQSSVTAEPFPQHRELAVFCMDTHYRHPETGQEASIRIYHGYMVWCVAVSFGTEAQPEGGHTTRWPTLRQACKAANDRHYDMLLDYGYERVA